MIDQPIKMYAMTFFLFMPDIQAHNKITLSGGQKAVLAYNYGKTHLLADKFSCVMSRISAM
jgi:hypothetical protein